MKQLTVSVSIFADSLGFSKYAIIYHQHIGVVLSPLYLTLCCYCFSLIVVANIFRTISNNSVEGGHLSIILKNIFSFLMSLGRLYNIGEIAVDWEYFCIHC